MKIENDKYYTPQWLAEYCASKTRELFPDITEFIEPSGGQESSLITYRKEL